MVILHFKKIVRGIYIPVVTIECSEDESSQASEDSESKNAESMNELEDSEDELKHESNQNWNLTCVRIV